MEIEEIKKAVIRKGDILVLRLPRMIPVAANEKIIEYLEKVLDKVGLKDSVGIIILQDGVEIYSILTQKEDDYIQKEAKKVGIPLFDPDLNDFQRRG